MNLFSKPQVQGLLCPQGSLDEIEATRLDEYSPKLEKPPVNPRCLKFFIWACLSIRNVDYMDPVRSCSQDLMFPTGEIKPCVFHPCESTTLTAKNFLDRTW